MSDHDDIVWPIDGRQPLVIAGHFSYLIPGAHLILRVGQPIEVEDYNDPGPSYWATVVHLAETGAVAAIEPDPYLQHPAHGGEEVEPLPLVVPVPLFEDRDAFARKAEELRARRWVEAARFVEGPVVIDLRDGGDR